MVHLQVFRGRRQFYVTPGFQLDLAEEGMTSSEVEQARWGSVTHVQLSGGGTVGLYHPTHLSPLVREGD